MNSVSPFWSISSQILGLDSFNASSIANGAQLFALDLRRPLKHFHSPLLCLNEPRIKEGPMLKLGLKNAKKNLNESTKA